jgi:hypothetical protein
MRNGPPKIVAINNDDYHAKHVGHTSDGRQFILTTPFEPAAGGAGNEFVALYLFDENGQLINARIEEFGPRATLDDRRCREVYDAWLKELGKVRFSRIHVVPFAIERFGTTFGLVAREPDDDDDLWAVEMQPGNYMAFFKPWDSGEYDT